MDKKILEKRIATQQAYIDGVEIQSTVRHSVEPYRGDGND